MSFVVEIPTVFTKPTQIPARLGNTILTGNETIEGSLSANNLNVNGPTMLNEVYVTGNETIEGSLSANNLNVNGPTMLNEVYVTGNETIEGSLSANNLNVNGPTMLNEVYVTGNVTIGNGNITSTKFRVIQPVRNFGNRFPEASLSTLTTIANNVVCYGGTLIFHVEVGGYSTGVTNAVLEVRYTNYSGQVKARIECPFHFSQTSVHQAWSRTHVETDVPASDMKLELWRNSTTLKSDTNDYINVTMYEMPY